MVAIFLLNLYSYVAECPETKLIGFKYGLLTKREIESFERAKRRCGEIYPNEPCLKIFEKKDDGTFWAICGKPKEDKEDETK